MRIFSYEELDELGEGLIRQYLGKEAERTCCVDIEGFVTDFLKLPLLYRSFAEEDSDKIGFIADGSTPLCVYENGEIKNRIYPRGTIVIERCLRREHESGRRRFTISHECAHYIMDRAVPSAAFHREFDNERIYSQEDFKNLFSFRETQIDRMGAALLMPRFMVHNVMISHGCSSCIPVFGDSILKLTDKALLGKWQIQWACPSPPFLFGCGSWAVCVTARFRSTSRRKWGWDRTVAQDEKSKRSP